MTKRFALAALAALALLFPSCGGSGPTGPDDTGGGGAPPPIPRQIGTIFATRTFTIEPQSQYGLLKPSDATGRAEVYLSWSPPPPVGEGTITVRRYDPSIFHLDERCYQSAPNNMCYVMVVEDAQPTGLAARRVSFDVKAADELMIIFRNVGSGSIDASGSAYVYDR